MRSHGPALHGAWEQDRAVVKAAWLGPWGKGAGREKQRTGVDEEGGGRWNMGARGKAWFSS